MSLVGTTIGRIHLLEALGEGGMGSVYMGYDETLERRVAVKAVRADRRLDADARGRFLREARLLSQLDHPGICRIHEIIESEDGDYLVLELVEGESLRQAMEGELDSEFRLYVAECIAEALAAAHAKGIAHRDLKPENVMLADDGGVRVLDFGLARRVPEGLEVREGVGEESLDDAGAASLDASPSLPPSEDATVILEATPWGEGREEEAGMPPDAGQSFATADGTVMGTLAYMSPEQARGEAITVAADMYSFGLLLQELFSGKPPYPPGLTPFALLVRAGHGNSEPVEGIDSELADWIRRLKAIAPEARPTAADTVERLRFIRTRKQRRLLYGALVLILLFFTGGILKYTVDLRREAAQKERALREAEQVEDFLVGLFAVSDPRTSRGQTITARELLDEGASRIRRELTDQPLSRARLMLTVGRVYRQLGLFDQSLPLLEEAAALYREHLSEGHLEIAPALEQLAMLYYDLGEYGQAEPLFLRALEIRREGLGPEHPYVAASLNNLADFYRVQGNDAQAEPLFRRALEIYRELHGDVHPDVATGFNNLGYLYRLRGDEKRAEDYMGRALAIQEQLLSPEDPNLATSLNNLATVYHDQGRIAEAEALYLRTLEIHQKVYGAEHPRVASILNNLAELYRLVGYTEKAEPLYRQALEIQEKGLGGEHPSVAVTLSNLADLQRSQGRIEQALALYEQVAAIQRRSLRTSHPDLAVTYSHQADLLVLSGDGAGGAELFRQALTVLDGAGERYRPSQAATRADLARALLAEGRMDEAQELLSEASQIAEALLAERPGSRAQRRLARIRLVMGDVLAVEGRPDEARARWGEVLERVPQKSEGELVEDLHLRAMTFQRLGEEDAAHQLLEELERRGWRDPELLEFESSQGAAARSTTNAPSAMR